MLRYDLTKVQNLHLYGATRFSWKQKLWNLGGKSRSSADSCSAQALSPVQGWSAFFPYKANLLMSVIVEPGLWKKPNLPSSFLGWSCLFSWSNLDKGYESRNESNTNAYMRKRSLKHKTQNVIKMLTDNHIKILKRE